MLTRKKEMSGSKRGTSPSPSVSTLRRSVDSSASEKTIPNYLKPTLSSSGDTTKLHVRKPVSNTDSALKLARRRSFDKPPSPTRTLKARGLSPTPTFRSSSFSGKTTTSPKGERSFKGGREAGKQPSLYARAVSTAMKSSTLLGKKGETRTASRKDPKLDNASELSDQESPISEQQMVNEHEDSPLADQEMDEYTITQQLEAEIQKVDSPTFLEEDDEDTAKADQSPTILEESRDDSHAASEQHDSTNVVAESPTNLEQHDANAAKVESPRSLELEEGDIETSGDPPAVPEHGEEHEESQEGKEDSSSINPDESVAAGDNNEEAEAKERDGEDENAAAPKQAHGKKDLALSNNVIEDMVREQRRNKVKALAGAFETVISLQDKSHNNNSS